MSRFLSWFKALSPLKKAALIIGVFTFIALLPIWLWISAVLVFLAGVIISIAALMSQNARERITRFKLPAIRLDKKPFAFAATVFIYFIAASVVFGAVATGTMNVWFGSQEKPTKVAEEQKKAPSKEVQTEKEEKRPASETVKVTRVIDGDTIEIFLDGKTEKVRLIGIDTPEKGKPYFNEATEKTKELCLGKEVRLEKDVSEKDRYDRLLRYVYVGDLFVNAELVKQGYASAYTYPPDVKYSELFRKLGTTRTIDRLTHPESLRL